MAFLAVLAACGSSGTTPPATKTEPSTGCVKVRKLDTRVGEPTAFGITAAFVVTDCSTGQGVSGLTTSSFTIEEDGKAVDAIESASVILSRTAEPYLTVVLDNTPTVRQSGATDAIADGAIALVDNLSKAAPNARVAVIWLDIKADVKQAFTNDFAKAKSAIEAYKTASAGTPSTNLYGGIVAAVDLSKQAQQARKNNQKNGVLTYGNIVVFTDGADNAAISTLQDAQAAVASTNDELQMVGFKHSDELDPETFKKLGNAPAVVVTSIEELKAAFAAKAEQIASLANGTYVLGYCTPKAAGTHTVTIRLPGKGASDPVPFEATPFQTQGGPACGVDKFQKACDGLECGGLWCGGCSDMCNTKNMCECAGGKGGAKCDVCLNSHKEFPSCDKCLPLYTGADCDQCADASKGGESCDLCANFGYELPSCKLCAPEFTGPTCEQCKNPHTEPVSKSGGKVVNEKTACKACKPGFTGADCNTCSDPKLTGEDCNVCVNKLFAAPDCSVCLNPNATGANCEICKDTGKPSADDKDCDGLASAQDCDDQDPVSNSKAADADCDGTKTADDCDDKDAKSTTKAKDADCDGVSTADDCNDNDAKSTTKATDADCDGAKTADDCDDKDPALGPKAKDQDCDGVLTTDDCNDQSPQFGAKAADKDCDGVPSADDCDDTQASLGAKAKDADCDGVATADDCNDQNPELKAKANDKDCDGVVAASDCDDLNPTSTTVQTDADCDKVLKANDCDDLNAQLGDKANDTDCDGVPNSFDCGPSDAKIGHTTVLTLVTQCSGGNKNAPCTDCAPGCKDNGAAGVTCCPDGTPTDQYGPNQPCSSASVPLTTKCTLTGTAVAAGTVDLTVKFATADVASACVIAKTPSKQLFVPGGSGASQSQQTTVGAGEKVSIDVGFVNVFMHNVCKAPSELPTTVLATLTCGGQWSPPSTPCVVAACNDSQSCTLDVCAANGNCAHKPVADGTQCTTSGGVSATCQLGLCGAPANSCKPSQCDDGNVCTVDGCGATGKCSSTPAPDGTACGSSLACKSGVCVSSAGGCSPASCNDNNPCTTDTCGANGKCTNTDVADGVACGSGLVCETGSCVSSGGGSGHYCDTHCGQKAPSGCYCDSACWQNGDCCDPTGTKVAGSTCTGSTCTACN